MARPLIAVVNDDHTFLELMETLLEEENYRVHTLRESAGAYQTIRRQKPELVVLDIRLGDPDDGFRVLELIRLDPSTKDIPVIICTADSSYLCDNEKQLQRMRCDILPKPFDLEQLLSLIAQCLVRSSK